MWRLERESASLVDRCLFTVRTHRQKDQLSGISSTWQSASLLMSLLSWPHCFLRVPSPETTILEVRTVHILERHRHTDPGNCYAEKKNLPLTVPNCSLLPTIPEQPACFCISYWTVSKLCWFKFSSYTLIRLFSYSYSTLPLVWFSRSLETSCSSSHLMSILHCFSWC